MGVVTKLDVDEFTKRGTKLKFPNIVLNNIYETTPLLMSVLEKGDVPVIATHKGVKKVIAYTSSSALNINKIVRTHEDVVYNKSESESIRLNSIVDYLEVV